MKKILLLTSVSLALCCQSAAAQDSPAETDFEKGILLVNEGWFGNDPGSINFLGYNGEMQYHLFETVNPGRHIGTTTESGACFGNKVFTVSKFNTDGAFITAINASTFEFIGGITEIPAKQAYFLCPVNEAKGYLSTNDGLFLVDLENLTVGKKIERQGMASGQFGQALRYGEYVFVVSQRNGVVVIDCETDEVTDVLDIASAEAMAVTADGSLYVATGNAAGEFIKINPTTLQTETINIDATNAKLPSPWQTWTMSPLAADKTDNILYYATKAYNCNTISKYDITSGTFTPDFIKLPGTEDGLDANRILYGQGISVDPVSGDIVILAVEAGYGDHYEKNWVYFADAATGAIKTDKTVTLDPYYWFPAQALYPDFKAPEISIEDIKLKIGTPDEEKSSKEIVMRDITTLYAGNPHIINYSASIADGDICTLTETSPGCYHIEGKETGTTTLTFRAEYQGKSAATTVNVTVDEFVGLDEINEESDFHHDVYTPSGVLMMRNASVRDLKALPAGLYIHGNRKIAIF